MAFGQAFPMGVSGYGDGRMIVKHIKHGWSSPSFEMVVQDVIDEHERIGWHYHDIKISSKSNDCLIIFKKGMT